MLSIEDRLDILEVIAQYSYTYDNLDLEGFVNLFTENALWEYYLSGKDEPEYRLTSHDDIREWAQPRFTERASKFSSRHHQTGTVFDSQDELNPRTRTMVLITHQGVGDLYPKPSNSGVYHDIWTKTERGWKISQRILCTDKIGS